MTNTLKSTPHADSKHLLPSYIIYDNRGTLGGGKSRGMRRRGRSGGPQWGRAVLQVKDKDIPLFAREEITHWPTFLFFHGLHSPYSCNKKLAPFLIGAAETRCFCQPITWKVLYLVLTFYYFRTRSGTVKEAHYRNWALAQHRATLCK